MTYFRSDSFFCAVGRPQLPHSPAILELDEDKVLSGDD